MPLHALKIESHPKDSPIRDTAQHKIYSLKHSF